MLAVFLSHYGQYHVNGACPLFTLFSGVPECVFSFKEIFQSSIIGMPLGIAYHLAKSLGLLKMNLTPATKMPTQLRVFCST